MSIRELARRPVRNLEPYRAAAQVDDTIRLNANEAAWRNNGDTFRRALNRYPEVRPSRLRQLLADHYGCDPANLLVTRGSSEAIDLLMRVFCESGRDNVVTTAPTFSMYEHYAVVQGAELRQVETAPSEDFRVDPARVLDACDEATKMVILCSPNNPTGTHVPTAVVTEILERRAGRSIVVVDEAYIEFAPSQSVVELVDRYDNLVVLRTLSKALAFAGARCGSVIAQPELIDMANAVQAPYALATPVIECVENALEADGLARAEGGIAETVRERERMRARLSEYTWVDKVWPSAANFLLVKVDDAARIMAHCATHQVLLRHFGGALADCLRITIGSAADNDRLLDALSTLEAGND
ncbi:MAG: histidinol-phosphate transaminase [Woeseiaceae bacterium]|nr:histidinol-phosphate transaminase [Woeseiaceae bacterium]